MPLLSNFIYIKNRNAIFVYVPKAACTNWKCICRYLNGEKDYLDYKIAHDRKKSGLTFLSRLSGKYDLLESKEIKKYSFVRNPYTRILSAYREKVQPYALGKKPLGQKDYWSGVNTVIHEECNKYDTGASFKDFLNWLNESDHEYVKNEHWLPQYDILSPLDIKYDFIGRMENFNSDVSKILNLLSCDISFPAEKRTLPPVNSNLCERYYGEEEKEKILELYKKDFEYFRYSVKWPPSFE